MEFGMKICVLVLLCFTFSVNARNGPEKCRFPAIFNFGDSNSDTGASYVLYNNFGWPAGLSVGHFFKRNSDGLLIIDLIAESFGLPYLNASVDINGTSFKYGANFAVGGQRANSDKYPNVWDYPLSEQVSQFLDLKSRAIASKEPDSTNIYPKPTVFPEALYTIDIGVNDVYSNFSSKGASAILDDYTKSVQRLLNSGAKYLWIHNTYPYGCIPRVHEARCKKETMQFPTCTIDEYGCIVEYNHLSQEYNSELKKRVDQWRKQYPEAVITLVDMYSAKHSLVTNAKGFENGLKFNYCCGSQDLACGQMAIYKENNTAVYVCDDPTKYYSWDGIHLTQAGNRYIANLIFDGSFSEPRVPLSQACKKA